MPFRVHDNKESFLDWVNEVASVNHGGEWVNFLVAFLTLERYLRRMNRAQLIFEGIGNIDATGQVEKQCRNLDWLIRFWKEPNRSQAILNAITTSGLIEDKFRHAIKIRNNIIHGNALGKPEFVAELTDLIWDTVRNLSDCIITENIGSLRTYSAWDRMPRNH
jgi:hypothetical protein